MVKKLADSKLFVSLSGDRRGNYPFVLNSFISGEAEELEQNLSPNHMMCSNTRFFKCLTATLDVAQGFLLFTEGAVRRVCFAPLVKKGATGELQTHRLHESLLSSIWEQRVSQTCAQEISATVRPPHKGFHKPR
jgi:hypothetical protein